MKCTIAIASVAICALLCGCEPEPSEYTQNEGQAPRFEIHNTNMSRLQVITDNQTGVQYLKFDSSGITPMLNSDGSLLLDGEVGGPLP